MADKITNTSRQGDFVHKSQNMGTEDGFRNVSQTWLDQCLTFDKALQIMEEDAASCSDVRTTIARLEIEQEGTEVLFTLPGGWRVRPSDWALEQFCKDAGLGTHAANQLRTSPRDSEGNYIWHRDETDAYTLATYLKNAQRRMDQDKPHLFRIRNDDTLRAYVSNIYGVIPNEWIINTLNKVIPGGLLSHWKGDCDTVIGNILIPDSIRHEDDSDYGGMVSLSNSEIGRRVFSLLPSLFRAICMNGCIWGQSKGEQFRKVHKGKDGYVDLDWLEYELTKHINEQIPLVTDGTAIERILATKKFKYKGDSMDPVWAQVRSQTLGMTKGQAQLIRKAYDIEVAECLDNKGSLFGVVNAITRAAQQTKNIDTWRQFEELGGQFLNYSKEDWSRFTKRASTLTAKQVERSFAVAS